MKGQSFPIIKFKDIVFYLKNSHIICYKCLFIGAFTTLSIQALGWLIIGGVVDEKYIWLTDDI